MSSNFTDTQRLEFLVAHDCHISWSRDREVCSLTQRGENGDENFIAQGANYPYWRDAIDAGIRTHQHRLEMARTKGDPPCHGPTMDAIAISERYEKLMFTRSPEGAEIGELLRRRRESYGPSGVGFGAWVEDNLDFSYSTALRFMREKP